MIKLRGAAGAALELPALWMQDGLAVTRAWGEPGYALQHIRSGMKLGVFEKKSKTIECGKLIASLAHWHDDRPTHDPESKKRIVALIEELGGKR